jgi:hypothetical protein
VRFTVRFPEQLTGVPAPEGAKAAEGGPAVPTRTLSATRGGYGMWLRCCMCVRSSRAGADARWHALAGGGAGAGARRRRRWRSWRRCWGRRAPPREEGRAPAGAGGRSGVGGAAAMAAAAAAAARRRWWGRGARRECRRPMLRSAAACWPAGETVADAWGVLVMLGGAAGAACLGGWVHAAGVKRCRAAECD